MQKKALKIFNKKKCIGEESDRFYCAKTWLNIEGVRIVSQNRQKSLITPVIRKNTSSKKENSLDKRDRQLRNDSLISIESLFSESLLKCLFTLLTFVPVRLSCDSIACWKASKMLRFDCRCGAEQLSSVINTYRVLSLFHFLKIKNYNHFKRLIELSNDIEKNPGPNHNLSYVKKSNLFTLTYNVRGLKDKNKMVRLINFFKQLEYKRNSVINLQETHLNENELNRLTKEWKYGVVQSPAVNNSGGVAILYNKSYFDEIVHEESIIPSRMCSLLAKKDEDVYCFINIYAPTNDNLSYQFLSDLDNYIFKIATEHPNTLFYVSGDFNVVMDSDIDSINRNQSKTERESAEFLKELIIKYGLVDSYREINKYGGYTWGRDNPKMIRSRLDMILISKVIKQNIVASNVYQQPNESDHRLLVTEVDNNEVLFGPGIVRVNSELLEIPEIKSKVENAIDTINIEMTFENPHLKLDYVKMVIRNILLEEGRIQSKFKKTALHYSNIEIERLNKSLDIELRKHNLLKCQLHSASCFEKIDQIKEAIILAKEDISKIKEEEAQSLIFRSRAKWAEKGEKSNKYFLNLLKERQRKMQIRKIVENGTIHYGQTEISKAITNFYRKLYKEKPVKDFNPEEEMFKNLPQLKGEDKMQLAKEMTLDELQITLKTCKESAPGPDGITYRVYERLWDRLGSMVLNSWNHSKKVGYTSQSQRHAIISLLEKKGKDKSKIENLRPISLSNCDIKICTKALALRTNKILHLLINNRQTGYVPGRQINDNSRYIEELIEMCKKTQKRAFLITLDAQKAFDSINHSYMLAILKHYNFPIEYIESIKILYSNLEASVLVNGFTGEKFKILQSVKQGDALSCALFILCMEPLLKSIQANENIKGVSINDQVTEDDVHNNFSFADDITAICCNVDGIQNVIDCYEKFSAYSGVKLNVPKTEIMVLGSQNCERECFDITSGGAEYRIFSQNKVKICGITFSNDPNVAYNENVKEKIIKLERQLNIWRQRNLTLQGKILIAKTFGISQLIYRMQSTSIKENDLIKIEEIIFKFIWNIKPSSSHSNGRLSREMMKKSYEEGGLKAPNIWLINDSLKFKHYLRCQYNTHPISKYTTEAVKANKLKSGFIANVINVKRKIEAIILNDIKVLKNENLLVNKEYKAYYQNLTLKDSNFFNIHQKSILTRLKQANIINVYDVLEAFQKRSSPNLFLEITQCYNTIPKVIREILLPLKQKMSSNINRLPYKLNIWKNNEQIKSSDIRKRLQKTVVFDHKSYLNRKHKIENDLILSNPFVNARICLKETRLQDIQFKILHDIYPTLSNLRRWKIKSNDMCVICRQQDDLRHSLFDCSITQLSILNLLKVFDSYNVKLTNLTYNEILFGTRSVWDTFHQLRQASTAIDNILVIIKSRLISMRENKRVISETEIFKIINDQIKLDSIKLEKIAFKRTWSSFIPEC